MRRPAALVVTGALLAALSCKTFDLPNETCNPTKQHGGELMPPLSDTSCNRCLEDGCCDAVGVCERKDGCTAIVSGVHACVIGHGLAGAREEATCARNLKLADVREADTAYRCMRDRCGGECGLPVCRVDPAALLIHSANCDSCFSSSCCPQLNACYASRACKLTIECIVKECGTSFGTTLTAGIASGAPDAGTGTFDGEGLCPTDGGTSPFGPPSCVQKCLCAFKDNDQGLASADLSQHPVNLALALYQCGVSAGCGGSCTDLPDAAAP